MKILQIINEFSRGGGAEKFLLDLSIAQKEEGNEVHILSIIAPSDSEFLLIAQQKGIIVHCLSNKLYSIRNIHKLYRFLQKNTFDVIHAHLFPTLYLVSIISFFYPSISYVYTEHSTKNRRRKYVIFRVIDSLIYKKYTEIVAISQEVKDALLKHLLFKKDVHIINNGIEVQLYEKAVPTDLRTELGIPLQTFIVMMVARFVKGKDYETLFKSIKYLSPIVHVVCVGDGPMLSTYKEKLVNTAYADRIHFCGLRKDIPALLKAADVVVLSSEHEGFSIAMLEAMAARKPFIASLVPGLNVAHNVALFFPYEDEACLAKQINYVFSSEKNYEDVAERCNTWVQQFDIHNVALNYIEIYKV